MSSDTAGFVNAPASSLASRRVTAFGFGGLLLAALAVEVQADPIALNTNLTIRFVMSTTNADGGNSIRLAKDTRDDLYYLRFNGDIYRLNRSATGGATSSRVYSSLDHGITNSAQGMAFGSDGSLFVVGNFTTPDGNSTFARVVRGTPNGTGGRTWSLFAQTSPYPRSKTAFDHVFNGIILSPDGAWVYLNSGSRTDHGEVQSVGGVFPGLREAPLTAKIFRLPAAGTNLFLPNDIDALRSSGYIFAEGTRNSFDFAFAPNGDLLAGDNGPDRDMSDELNWLRPGLHFGFPWRIGGADNPQQYPNYDPQNDKLLNPLFVGVYYGYYQNDPTFPPPPTNFFEPVINLGPDADEFRDPADGSLKDASDLGLTLSTFTAHRTPLGLVFDVNSAMAPPFQNHGFILSFNPGDPNGSSVAGPFNDASQDLVELDLTKLGTTNYQARITRVAAGFAMPIDAEIIGNRIYVIEYAGTQGIWELTFPPTPVNLRMTGAALAPDSTFHFMISGVIREQQYEVLVSTNLVDWTVLTNITALSTPLPFADQSGPGARFYRVRQVP